jgi:hypothetical protein
MGTALKSTVFDFENVYAAFGNWGLNCLKRLFYLIKLMKAWQVKK